MIEQLKTIREALERLSCLGNGSHYGNSDGNRIAQEVLPLARQLESLVGEQEPICWAESDGEGGILWDRDSCFSDDPAWFDSPMPLYAAPVAQQQEPDPTSLLFAVEQAVKNGHCPWEIEAAFDEYEAARKAAPVAQQYEAGDMASASAQGFRDGVASVDKQQEPVAWAMPKGDGTFIDVITPAEHAREEGSYTVPLFAHPVAQQHETVTNDEQARAYMDARLWEFIDMAGMWPKAKPDPRIWAHVMVYAPVAQQPQAEAVPVVDRVYEAAKRLVDHADFQLGGVLSAKSKARDIPSNAASKVKARHLASLRDALAKTPQQAEVPSDVVTHRDAWREALVIASLIVTESADADYWAHEIQAFDRTFDALTGVAAAPHQVEAPRDVVRDAERWRTFLATRPANTHAVINQAIDDAATRKGGGV